LRGTVTTKKQAPISRRLVSKAPPPPTPLAESEEPEIPYFLLPEQDPIPENPFAANDERHVRWVQATGLATADVLRFNAEMAATFERADGVVSYAAFASAVVLKWFEIWGGRGARFVRNLEEFDNFDQWLAEWAQFWLDDVKASWSGDFRPFVLGRLPARLKTCVAHWRAEAYGRFQRATSQASSATTTARAPVRAEAVTVAEAATILHLSEDTVRRKIKSGEIEAISLGPRSTRIPRSELARLRSPNARK